MQIRRKFLLRHPWKRTGADDADKYLRKLKAQSTGQRPWGHRGPRSGAEWPPPPTAPVPGPQQWELGMKLMFAVGEAWEAKQIRRHFSFSASFS